MFRTNDLNSIHHNTASSRRMKMKKDAFPILDIKEITECLIELDFNVTQELITKPTTDFVTNLFEQLLDTFMGIPIETIKMKSIQLAKNSINEQEQNDVQDGDDEEQPDTLPALYLFTLQRFLNSFLSSIGIYDSSVMDIAKPEPLRLKRILSAFINYARFREEQSNKFEQLAKESEQVSDEIKLLQTENEASVIKINQLNQKLKYDKSNNPRPNLQQVSTYNRKLESKLKEMKINQESLTKQHDDYKVEKQKLIEQIFDVDYVYRELLGEIDNLKNYLNTDLDLLNRVIQDLSNEYHVLTDEFEKLTLKLNNVNTTIDSLQVNELTIKELIRISQENVSSINQLKSEQLKNKNQKQKNENLVKTQYSDSMNQIKTYETQLLKSNKKFNDILQQSDKKRAVLKQNLQKSTDNFNKIMEERGNRNVEHKAQIEKINTLRYETEALENNFENEVKEMESKMTALNSVIKRYMSELNESFE